ncbi:MAG: hypothetical protein LBR23_01100 [Spirochaetaceae bacterium]|nr:hypothetical protein [Spirochaetaceae bacterium]
MGKKSLASISMFVILILSVPAQGVTITGTMPSAKDGGPFVLQVGAFVFQKYVNRALQMLSRAGIQGTTEIHGGATRVLVTVPGAAEVPDMIKKLAVLGFREMWIRPAGNPPADTGFQREPRAGQPEPVFIPQTGQPAPVGVPAPGREPLREPVKRKQSGDLEARLEKARAKSGVLEVSLLWNNRNDLDLHVITPSEEEIDFDHPADSAGGFMDVNTNSFGETDRPVEHILWEHSAPRGTYKVFVRNFLFHEADHGPTAFTVTVKKDGEITEYPGQVEGITAGGDSPAAEFTY